MIFNIKHMFAVMPRIEIDQKSHRKAPEILAISSQLKENYITHKLASQNHVIFARLAIKRPCGILLQEIDVGTMYCVVPSF